MDQIDRVFVAALVVVCIMIARLVFIQADSVWGPIMTYGSVIIFILLCVRWTFAQDKISEAARRRADGID